MDNKILFYGACDDDGQSYIFKKKPTKQHGVWLTGDKKDIVMQCENDYMFCQDNPETLQLTPVVSA